MVCLETFLTTGWKLCDSIRIRCVITTSVHAHQESPTDAWGSDEFSAARTGAAKMLR
jgi:hypothetical protein